MIGEELRRFRERQLRMTQAELSKELGITPRTLSGYENRIGNIPVIVERAVKTVVANPIPY